MVSESVSCPVSMMIGALKPPLRKLRTTSRPSVSGNPTSISTRSGESFLAAVAPLAPVSTADASNSSCSDNCSTRVSRKSVSSSTINILRALGIGTILEAAGSGRKQREDLDRYATGRALVRDQFVYRYGAVTDSQARATLLQILWPVSIIVFERSEIEQFAEPWQPGSCRFA